jgi:two-component system, OmpR family, response regulator PhoP
MRLLVIEDEDTLRTQLQSQFQKQGFSIDLAADGEEGLFLGKEYPIDIAVVDLGLPKMSGMEAIRQIRASGKDFPIIILTARDRWQEKVEGLEAGADDYLVKPFQFEELSARVNALLRRSSGWSKPVLEFAPIELDTVSQTVKVSNHLITLTSYEYKTLEYLMMNDQKVVSKMELTEHIYEQDFDRDSNVIEVFIGRLRKKIDPENDFKPIETLRGRGYRFALSRTGNDA